MKNKPIDDKKRIMKQLSDYLDKLIDKVVIKGIHDPDIENQIRELNEMMKSLAVGFRPYPEDSDTE